MKLNCAIVKDLLPLYADNLCADETADSVREHLAECADCRREYEAATVTIEPAVPADDTPVKPFRKVRRAIIKRAVVIAACVALLMATSVGVYAAHTNGEKCEIAITAEIQQKETVCYYNYGDRQDGVLRFADTDVVTQDETTGQVYCNGKPLTVPENPDMALDNQANAYVSRGSVAVYVGTADNKVSYADWDAYEGENGELIRFVKLTTSRPNKEAVAHERHYMSFGISDLHPVRLLVPTNDGDLLYDLNETFRTGKLVQINA